MEIKSLVWDFCITLGIWFIGSTIAETFIALIETRYHEPKWWHVMTWFGFACMAFSIGYFFVSLYQWCHS